jgi:8-oxo-dGTP diphosphatase
MKHIEVAAAIIINNDKILCVQRNTNKYEYISLKYEFPGGKIEDGETSMAALIREIKEELSMDIVINNPFLTVNHDYPDFSLTMESFVCSCTDSNLTLTEHVDYKWLAIDELTELDWAAADIPIVKKLANS